MRSLELIEKELSELDVKMDKAFDLPTFEKYLTESGRIWKQKIPLLYEKYEQIPIKWNDIPTYGDKMTIQDFISCCESGGFIDSDGSGYYANETNESNIPALPSMITSGKITKRPELTHVIWYNK